MEKKNRSYVLQTVVSKNGSWNSDFTHSPKKYDNQYFASDRALKYAVRNLMEQMGKEVLIKKWVKGIKKGTTSSIQVMTNKELKKHIEKEYGEDFSKVFWKFADVRQFGMVYDNINVHGVAQISQGLDVYRNGVEYFDAGTGRMVFNTKGSDPSGGEGETTRGMFERHFLSEAHYAYNIVVNPANISFLQSIQGYEGCIYTEEDYKLLLESLEYGPINVQSTQKMNCFTGFLMTVDLAEDTNPILADLQGKLNVSPGSHGEPSTYDLANLFTYLEHRNEEAGGNAIKQVHIKYDEASINLATPTETNLSISFEVM
ncbi:type I CRISPR-associated protein Cas7 [Pontibacillus halophilus]|uniref:type I CRISPR-associated protein Cas7 n=1 Tax=Pontibacillus halophilus TaxID=516704 RepID=UPI00041C22E1|nr:type I CRISPR-associated protein Cas7 [Pontibacillus halophilus]